MRFIKRFEKEKNELVIIILRFAVGSVFLWFGVDKWVHPEAWYGWVPGWAWKFIPFSPQLFMHLNGAMEFIIGILLVSGRFIRPAAAVAGLFLLSLFIVLGSNEVTVRDMGILGGCLALFVHANDTAVKKVPMRWIAVMTAGYVFILFIVGVLYLKSGQ